MDQEISRRLKESIKRHEGFKSKPYKDTKGNVTIAYGRNLDHVGINESEAEILLNNDIDNASEDLYRFLPFARELDDVRKAVLIELTFNIGIEEVMHFRKMIECLKQHDFKGASDELLDSKWREEVGGRAQDMAFCLETGKI